MATANAPKQMTAVVAKLRDEWLSRVARLVESAEKWTADAEWSTRRIEKQIEDSEIGDHTVPSLLLQEGTTRMLLEPIARSAPGVEGVVDLYKMPAYDDVATLYFYDGQWHLHRASSGTPGTATAKPLSKEAFLEALGEMKSNGA